MRNEKRNVSDPIGTGNATEPVLADVYFRDVESDYTIQQGRLDGSFARRYFFGGSGSDVFAGGSYADHLYSGAGDDSLRPESPQKTRRWRDGDTVLCGDLQVPERPSKGNTAIGNSIRAAANDPTWRAAA